LFDLICFSAFLFSSALFGFILKVFLLYYFICFYHFEKGLFCVVLNQLQSRSKAEASQPDGETEEAFGVGL